MTDATSSPYFYISWQSDATDTPWEFQELQRATEQLIKSERIEKAAKQALKRFPKRLSYCKRDYRYSRYDRKINKKRVLNINKPWR